MAGTAVDANELTLLWEFRDVCEREMPELAKDGRNRVANPVLSAPVPVDVPFYH